ncbi:MAG: tetratricopeptide repeat protein, partial [Planctomycetes bacterium]|nr:tetratricopeptide repeat protein [Planctomycetota bacterium]
MTILNPYTTAPIRNEAYFFGREDVFRFVRETLASSRQNVIVLFGQRRVGKTSILLQLPHHLPTEFHHIYFNLEDKAQLSRNEVLLKLAGAIATSLNLAMPPQAEFRKDVVYFRDHFLPTVYEALGNKRLLLLFDEFDVMSAEPLIEDAAVETLFPYLRQLIAEEERLAFVFVSGRRIEDLVTHFQQLFKSAHFKRISLLDQKDAVQLITEPTKGILEYDAAAINRILSLTSNHPCFIQLICFEVFGYLQHLGKTQVTAADVEAIVDDVLERGSTVFTWFWDELPPGERFVLSAIAHIAEMGDTATREKIRDVLEENDVRLSGMELTNAPDMLVKWEILREEGRRGYKFRVELLQLWIAKKHSLEEVQPELLDLVSRRASHLYEAGLSAHLDGDLELAIRDYRSALAANPNHRGAQLKLAQALYEQGDLSDAVEEFTKAHKLDPVNARDGFAEALSTLAASLNADGKVDQAIMEYERILKQVASGYEDAQRHLANIWIERGEKHLAKGNLDIALEAYKRALDVKPEDKEARSLIRVRLKHFSGECEKSDWVSAVKALTWVVELEPDQEEVQEWLASAWIRRGVVHLDANRFKDALAAFQKALDIQPDD